jgi:hypothetical protein
MAIIKKKTWPVYFEAVASGKKNFDLRLDDFAIKEGDTLVLEEWDPEMKEYTGRTIEKKSNFCREIQNRPALLAGRRDQGKRRTDTFPRIVFVEAIILYYEAADISIKTGTTFERGD